MAVGRMVCQRAPSRRQRKLPVLGLSKPILKTGMCWDPVLQCCIYNKRHLDQQRGFTSLGRWRATEGAATLPLSFIQSVLNSSKNRTQASPPVAGSSQALIAALVTAFQHVKLAVAGTRYSLADTRSLHHLSVAQPPKVYGRPGSLHFLTVALPV